MLTEKQTVKIDNWKAQHNGLLQSIQDTNTKLEDLLRRVSTTERELKVVNKELFVKRQELADILESILEADNRTDKKTKLLEQQEKVTLKVIDDLDKTEKRLNDVIKEFQKGLDKITKQIDSAETSLILAKLTTEERQRKLKEVNKTIQTKANENRELDSSLSKLKHDVGESKKLFDKTLEEQTKTLKDVTDKVKEETKKLELPNKLLDERTKELTKKETNYQIKALRWKKLFTKMFPNQEFKY